MKARIRQDPRYGHYWHVETRPWWRPWWITAYGALPDRDEALLIAHRLLHPVTEKVK